MIKLTGLQVSQHVPVQFRGNKSSFWCQKKSCSSIITVFLPTWTITEIQMVLENRVIFRLSFEKTISHPVPGQTSISTAILVLTPSYSWRIITRYIVSTTWCRFRFLIWLSCFSIYNHDVRVWQDYPYTLASCNRLYYPCLLFSHAADLRLEFMEHHPQYVADGNSVGFLSDDGGHKYNLCHCKLLISTIRRRWLAVLVWSNFEIADMNFWRGPAYTDFFNYLDSKGGFYYEVRAMLRYRTAKWTNTPSALGRRTRT